MLQGLIRQYQQAAEAARQQFQRELEAAKSDGKIDDGERDRLHEVQTAYTRAESLIDKYMEKLRAAQEGTAKAAEAIKTQGSFYAAAFDALGSKSTEDRVANATEMIAQNTKKTNDILRRKNGLQFT